MEHVRAACKVVLSCLIDACEVITRLVSLVYGADLVWGPEVVDKAMIGAERVVNGRRNVSLAIPAHKLSHRNHRCD